MAAAKRQVHLDALIINAANLFDDYEMKLLVKQQDCAAELCSGLSSLMFTIAIDSIQ